MVETSFDLKLSQQRCLKYRKAILALSQQVPALHMASAFSCTEMMDVIYHGLMRRDENFIYQDDFVLSKGHGCAIQYVILHDLGVLNDRDMALFCKSGGRLGAHPDYGAPGIAASTGSLGHGLGLSVGMAYANRLNDQDSKIYVIISDGELQEGSTWEAIMMAANLKLGRLVVFLDLNNHITAANIKQNYQAFYPVSDKLKAFNWQVHDIDGHDADAIFHAGRGLAEDAPTFVICHTMKGKGVSYMEKDMIWHYRSPNAQEYQIALDELSSADHIEYGV